jgi:hypothetical protein
MLKDKLLESSFDQRDFEINGITVVIKEMNAGDAVKYESSLYKLVNNQPIMTLENSKAKLIMLCVYDKDNNRVFDEKDIANINKMSAKTVNQLFQICSDLNGIVEVKN